MIAKKIKIAPSLTVGMNQLAQKKKAAGESVVNFAAGDPVLENHPLILEGAKRALEKRNVPYTPTAGIPELRKAATKWMNERHHAEYKDAQCLVTAGGKFALYAALQALLDEGDEVLIPAPYWVSYPEMVKVFGAVPCIVPSNEGQQWKITASDIEKQLSKKSKVLILNNAANPTGALYSEEEIAAILNVAKAAQLMVISDEVYSGLVYPGKRFVSCSSFPEHQERVIVVESCSKNFGMTGWRVGFAFASQNIIEVLTALQGHSTTAASSISQWAALSALENAVEVGGYIKNAMQRRRTLFVETFNALFKKQIALPDSGLYLFLPIEERSSVEWCERVLKEAGVASVPGAAFGFEGYVRFAFSETEDSIVKGLKALHEIHAFH